MPNPEAENPQPIHEQISDIESDGTETTAPNSELPEIANKRLAKKLIQLMEQTKSGQNEANNSDEQRAKISQLNNLSKELTGQRVEILALNLFESKTLDVMERLSEITDNKRDLAICFVGFDSSRAWALREKLVEGKKSASENDIVLGLAGVESERAWEMRDSLLQEGEIDDVCRSLAGLDSDRAWQMRGELLDKRRDDRGHIVASLAGLNTVRALEMRKELLNKSDPSDIARSIIALDSDEAWEIREEQLGVERDPSRIGLNLSLVGIDSAGHGMID